MTQIIILKSTKDKKTKIQFEIYWTSNCLVLFQDEYDFIIFN